LQAEARDAMQKAVMHHGLDGLQVYPTGSFAGAEHNQRLMNFMGVKLVETELVMEKAQETGTMAANPSARADNCARLFAEIVIKSAVLAGVTGNLHRLLAEYRITERRSRALENIILPEIERTLRETESHIEELDLEDAIRVRQGSKVAL
jgi:V/A-type H+-transporting ATPase subunit D